MGDDKDFDARGPEETPDAKSRPDDAGPDVENQAAPPRDNLRPFLVREHGGRSLPVGSGRYRVEVGDEGGAGDRRTGDDRRVRVDRRGGDDRRLGLELRNAGAARRGDLWRHSKSVWMTGLLKGGDWGLADRRGGSERRLRRDGRAGIDRRR